VRGHEHNRLRRDVDLVEHGLFVSDVAPDRPQQGVDDRVAGDDDPGRIDVLDQEVCLVVLRRRAVQ
jgi:hypothetical protein